MEKIKKILIPVLLIGILLLPIIVDYIKNNTVEVRTYTEYTQDQKNSEFSLIYFGDVNSEKYESIEETLLELKKEYATKSIYSVDNKKLTEEQTKELSEQDINVEKESAYVFIKNGDIVRIITESEKNVNLDAQVNKYLNNVIPEEEIAYKTISTFKEFDKLYKSKNAVMHVFGRNTCYYCNIFKPVYNDVAAENNLEVYYHDSDVIDSKEYNKILNSGVKIPAECTSTKEEQPLSKGFGTPLTLFTKNGKVIGCLTGYTNKTELISKLEKLEILN